MVWTLSGIPVAGRKRRVFWLGCVVALVPSAFSFAGRRPARQAGEDPAIRALEIAQQDYQAIEARGGWRVVDSGPRLEPGMTDPRVSSLRQRLAAEGYQPGANPPDSSLYDDALASSVRRFQELHGLEQDGIVGAATLAALNVPAAARIRQIGSNLERRRASPDSLAERYIRVNAAGFTLEVVDSGRVLMRLRTIVGRPDWPTPVVNTRLAALIFRPLWRVPRSIAVQEILRLVRRDSTYLRRIGMRVFRDSADGVEVNPDSVDWTRMTPRAFAYQFVQEPGPDNPLGGVKLALQTSLGVHLHDTNAPRLFDRPSRALSHGCVRVDEVEQLVSYLLPAWPIDSIRSAMATGRERLVPLSAPIPVYLVYWTAWSEGDGPIAFRTDVYHLDP